jgi:putative ABC transport system permease protein
MELGPILRSLIRNRGRVLLLVVEIAFTVAIALNCANMIIDQRRIANRPTGIAEEEIAVLRARPYGSRYEELEGRLAVMRQDLVALRAMPDVEAVAPIAPLPLQGGGSSSQFRPLGAAPTALVRAPVYRTDGHFIETLGLDLVAGRSFTEADMPTDLGAQNMNVIVTQDLADALFPDGDALGKQISGGGSETYPDVIVGIVDHMYTPYGGGPMETRILFYPTPPAYRTPFDYLIRADPGELSVIMKEAQAVLLEVDDERLIETLTMLEVKSWGAFDKRLVATILTVIIGLLLFVTGIGVLGMTAFAVTQRTKQVGTRRALGASRADVLRYFLVENTIITVSGIALGLIGAYTLNIVLMQQAGGTPLPIGLVLTGVLVLWGLGIVATIAPALRASRTPPALATRSV